MICDSCIHKEVCYEKEEDRRALKYCSDYFNYAEELEKIKAEMEDIECTGDYTTLYELKMAVVELLEYRIAKLKGEQK